jgi:hypothetical protein
VNGTLRVALAVFAVLFLASLLLAWPALGWPMTFDDLHLLRTYPARFLLAGFGGHWDPQRLMTAGYRPLTTLFNHVRMLLCGEDVVAHRLLLLALGSATWAWLALSLRAWELAPRTTLLAGALWFASIYSVFHYVWITDGNHMLQGLAFAAAVDGLARGLPRASKALLAASLLAFALALLTREDSLALAPALALMALALSRRAGASLRAAGAYALALGLTSLAFLLLRRVLVPRSQPPGSDFGAPFVSFVWALSPAGTTGFDALTWALVLGWWGVLGLLALAWVRRRPLLSPMWGVPLWLACALVTCAPAVNVLREDLLFFPVLFSSLALALVLGETWACGGWRRGLAAVAAAWALLGGSGMSRVYAENFHPESLRTIWWNGRFVYGAYAHKARLPPQRRAAVVAQLHRFQIDEAWGHEIRTRKLEQRAIAEGRRRPGDDGLPFYPWLPWSED